MGGEHTVNGLILQFEFLVSFSTLRNFFNGQYPTTWYWNPCWTYVLLKEGVKPAEVEKFFPALIQKYFPEFVRNDARLELQVDQCGRALDRRPELLIAHWPHRVPGFV